MGKKFVLGMLILGVAGSVSAADLSNKFGLGIKGGYSIPVFGNSFNDVADADIGWGGHLRYFMNEYANLEVGYFRSTFDKVDIEFDTYSLMGVWRMAGASDFSPIFGIGAGVTKIRNYEPHNLKMSALARLGVEQTMGGNFSVGLYADYQYTSKVFGDIPGTKGLHTVTPTLALNFQFGGSGSSVAYYEPVKEDEVSSVAAATQIRTDSDGDGVYDDEDKCSATMAGAKVNAMGCAVDETAQMKINVEFPTGKSTIAPQYNEHLKEVADYLKKHDDVKVDVQGYTDSTGNWTFNEKLSQKRAEAVRSALVKMGVERKRVSAKGFGPRNPIADNSTAEGRKENRRVVAELKSMESSVH